MEGEPLTEITMATVVYNEAGLIAGLLDQAKEYASEILVLNCSSTDGTRHIAELYTDKVIDRPCTGSSGIGGNKQECIRLASNPWIIFLDGDELLDAELLEAVKTGKLIEEANTRGLRGLWLRRKWLVDGLRFDYFKEDWQLRFLKKETAKWGDGVHMTPNIEFTDMFYRGWIVHNVISDRFFTRYEIYSKLEPSVKPFNDKVVAAVREFLEKRGKS